jgi:5-oxoprolinase (ATP-hydrolysing)
MRAPMMRIHTVAAGGGSILHYDGGRFQVGPDSAGANPGPACYRRGGPLTVTDANVMLGKLHPGTSRRLRPRWQDEPLDAEAVRAKFTALAERSATARRRRTSPKASSRIAVENMANAIKKISVQRGYDVTGYALNCFGGAGGQHACLVADALGMKTVLIHPFAGVLSAYGMGLADIRLAPAGACQPRKQPRRIDGLIDEPRRKRPKPNWAQGICPPASDAPRCTCATRAPTRHRHRPRHGDSDAGGLRGRAQGAVRLHSPGTG